MLRKKLMKRKDSHGKSYESLAFFAFRGRMTIPSVTDGGGMAAGAAACAGGSGTATGAAGQSIALTSICCCAITAACFEILKSRVCISFKIFSTDDAVLPNFSFSNNNRGTPPYRQNAHHNNHLHLLDMFYQTGRGKKYRFCAIPSV